MDRNLFKIQNHKFWQSDASALFLLAYQFDIWHMYFLFMRK